MQNFPRNYAAQRSPNASRRGPGPLVPPPPSHQPQPAMTAQQAHQQHLDSIRRTDLARRQAKKPTDRDIPEEISEAIVGDGVDRYKKLRDVERRLDANMMRKRLDVNENTQRRYTRKDGILRIWISNTAEGQSWQVADEGAGNEDKLFDLENDQATYRVKIEGRLLEDPEDKADDTAPPAQRQCLSSFFKAITIDFDRDSALQPDNFHQIEWRKPDSQSANYDPNSSEASFDTLEFERKGDVEMNININLIRDERNERFKVSPELAEIIDTDEEDRLGAIEAIWEYCRAMGLQEDDDKRTVKCDDALTKVFNRDTISFPYLPDMVYQHLQPLPPIRLQYTIRVDKAYINGTPDPNASTSDESGESLQPSRPTVYDVRVPLPSTLLTSYTRFQRSRSHISDLQTIVRTDDDLALLVQKIHQTNAKRKFYDNLAKDPASFIKRWISSQQRDLEVILAEATRGGGEEGTAEEFRRSGRDSVWGTEQARESVGLWLSKESKVR